MCSAEKQHISFELLALICWILSTNSMRKLLASSTILVSSGGKNVEIFFDSKKLRESMLQYLRVYHSTKKKQLVDF